MTRRRTLHLPALLGTLAAAVLVACVVALCGPSEKAEATFPGKNGRIAYMDSFSLYTIHPDGSGKTKVTTTTAGGYSIDYSPTGKTIMTSVARKARGLSRGRGRASSTVAARLQGARGGLAL